MKLGLSGKQGVGKSTIADHLIKHYGFKRYSFAAKLKAICTEMFPDKMMQPKAEYRKLLQMVGTEWFRSVDSEVWVKYLIRHVSGENVIVDDVRFKNEADALREAGFLVVRVERDEELRGAWGYNVEDSHSSETALDDYAFDYVLFNDGAYPFSEAAERLYVWMVTQCV